jgi:hypothetical protein
MKNIFVIGFLILFSLNSQSQNSTAPNTSPQAGAAPEASGDSTPVVDTSKFEKPKSRQRTKNDEPPHDSSSFIGDPDNLDPLEANHDSLKEDEEPVLEDIKDVLKTGKTKSAAAGEPSATPTDSTDVKSKKKRKSKKKPKISDDSSRSSDDPDLVLEKKFHNIYQTYNKTPTPDDVWAAASGKQTSHLYEVQKGDTLWSISKILFGDPNFWPKVWAINKQGILNPHFINPKMKVYFYEGDEQNSPTLTVGENPPPPEAASTAAAKTEEVKPPEVPLPGVEPVTPPKLVTAAEEVAPEARVTRNKYPPLKPIPPSLPEGRNVEYFDGFKRKFREIRVDLGVEPKSEFYFSNDIVITDVEVKSDVKLSIDEVQKLRCAPGRVLKEIEYENPLVSEYDIYEKLDGVQTTTGFKNSYRLTGRAKSYKDKYLQVVDCDSFISTDLLFVPKDQMRELATQQISNLEEPKIIGGPDNNQQKYYSVLQYAYVDFGSQNYNVGSSYKTVSDISDQINGEFKVIEKFGSYAVVIMTDIKDQVSLGDKVIVK